MYAGRTLRCNHWTLPTPGALENDAAADRRYC
jgi:hypothetical protein